MPWWKRIPGSRWQQRITTVTSKGKTGSFAIQTVTTNHRKDQPEISPKSHPLKGTVFLCVFMFHFWLSKLSYVLGKTYLGADLHFWAKTRFGILVKSSIIWANQVWPRAILKANNDPHPNVFWTLPFRCSPHKGVLAKNGKKPFWY